MIRKTAFIIGLLILSDATKSWSGDRKFVEIKSFKAKEAKQGVAVDDNYFYAISNRQIGKYDKKTFEFIASWIGKEDGPIIHLNGGSVIDGKLYCAHSNYPKIPMVSSVEIWDVETLEHIGNHSFGIHWGSCTWVDRHDGYWWAGFAQYEKWKYKTGKGSEWTTVVKFDDSWRSLGGWVFPDTVIQRMRPMSNSGGSWGPDGFLYCTGHDHPEVYVFQIPDQGSVLDLIETVPLAVFGESISWDRFKKDIIYGIRKKKREVVISRFIKEK